MAFAELYAALRDADADTDTTWRALRAAATAEPAAFAAFLARQPIDAGCSLFEVYEALMDDEAAFLDLLGAELERLVELAIERPRDAAIYQQLDAFGLAETPMLRLVIADAALSMLRSPLPPLRRFAANLAGGLLPMEDAAVENALRDHRANDPDWRVRVLSHVGLSDPGAVSRAVTPLALADRLRMRFRGPSLYDYAA